MPVVDTPVHERVKEKEGAVYGCWNKPRPNENSRYLAIDGYDINGCVMFAVIYHNMSTECRFDMSLKDPKCNGCEWRGSGEAYDEMVRRNGK